MKIYLLALATFMLGAELLAAAPDLDGARVGVWTMDLDAAKAVAAERNLPIFVNFTGSDWCGWCKVMDKQVFSEAAWADYATQALLTVWIDFPEDESLVPERYQARNKELQAQYNVEGYPTYVVLDADGQTEVGRLGADRDLTPERFIMQVEDVLGNRASAMAAMLEDMAPEQSAAFKEKTAQLAAAREEQARVEAEAMAALKQLTEEIESLEQDVARMRTDWRLSKLTDEQRAAYQVANTAYEEQRAALNDWLRTEPEPNEDNQQKFTAMSGKLGELEQARNRALRGE